MAIEINGIQSQQPPVTGEGGQVGGARNDPQARGAEPEKPEAGGTGDKASLTDTAIRLQEVENKLAEQPVVDRQRVEAIRQAIADGGFEVRPERIAAKMLDLEQMLSGGR